MLFLKIYYVLKITLLTSKYIIFTTWILAKFLLFSLLNYTHFFSFLYTSNFLWIKPKFYRKRFLARENQHKSFLFDKARPFPNLKQSCYRIRCTLLLFFFQMGKEKSKFCLLYKMRNRWRFKGSLIIEFKISSENCRYF